MSSKVGPSFLALLIFSASAWSAGAREPVGPGLPTPAAQHVDFDAQVRPILESRCLKCHTRGKYKGGLSLESRETLLRGGEGGPAVVVGKSGESRLIALVAGLEPDTKMPPSGVPLSPQEVAVLRAWIDQGMDWPEASGFGFRKATLAPRRPLEPPPISGEGLGRPIDRFVARSLGKAGVRIDWTPVSDRQFARRVSLDLVGLLPRSERWSAYEHDAEPGKEARFVEALLEDRSAYADHWLTFWNDALRNAYRGTGFIDGGRKTITRWLYQSLYENKPYDRFVRELIDPVPGSEGFTKGIVWRGVVNASQAPPVQAAQNVSQVFLGTNLKCASCHDSFVNHWTLKEAYALAGVFADNRLEIHRCDKPTGKMSKVGFIYPELGTIAAEAPRRDRMKQLADLVVKPEDGRFARTIVNRLWAVLMGRGIVEPLDDMDQAPWDQDLLDWLADDFVSHGHDIKHTLALIATSRAYRLPSVGLPAKAPVEGYIFRGPLKKRMTAEQFADAVSTITGVWSEVSPDLLKVDGRGQGGQVAEARAAVAASDKKRSVGEAAPARLESRWIWSHADAEHDPGGRILLRKVIHLDELPDRAIALAACDNELALYVNGQLVAENSDWNRPSSVDITSRLKPGDNVIAAEATNWPDAENGRGVEVKGANPAAFLAWIGGFRGGRPSWGVGTDSSWVWSRNAARGWKGQGFEPTGWNHAVELPDAARIYGGAVNLATLVDTTAPGDYGTPLRAALAFDDPLQTALGRTSREQVVTRRDPTATTLQALEMSNGTTLDRKLKQGAERWLERSGNVPDALIGQLYSAAFGRAPRPEERAAARELVGTPANREGVQDLFWILTMLPEFQLID